MKIVETDLPGCIVLEPQVFGDERGFFFESYNTERLRDAGLALPPFVQGNVSSSTRGVLRGLHYQRPNPQGKYVSVLEGEVFDAPPPGKFPAGLTWLRYLDDDVFSDFPSISNADV